MFASIILYIKLRALSKLSTYKCFFVVQVYYPKEFEQVWFLVRSRFGANQLRYLGHLITRDGIKIDPDKTEAITRIPPPKDVREVRQFLGLLSWYRRFVDNFAERARPLTKLTSKKTKWQWTEAEEGAFNS